MTSQDWKEHDYAHWLRSIRISLCLCRPN